MDQILWFLRWFLNGVTGLVKAMVDLLARVAQGIGGEFDYDISDAEAQLLGMVLATLVLYAFGRRLFKWERKANQPQSFPIKTAETPAQVVAKDRDAFLALLVRLVLVMLAIAFVISLRS